MQTCHQVTNGAGIFIKSNCGDPSTVSNSSNQGSEHDMGWMMWVMQFFWILVSSLWGDGEIKVPQSLMALLMRTIT